MLNKRRKAKRRILFNIILNRRSLVLELIRREFTSHYRGTIGGLIWPILQPVLMLTVYSFTFGYILQARGGLGENNTSYVLLLFSGLIIHHAFAESINKSVRLILSNQNFVKKIVFPLELLSLTLCLSILINLTVSLLILLTAITLLDGMPGVNALWTLLVIIVFIPTMLAASWFLAAVGVFLRDIGQVTGILSHALLFLSPVFYRLDNAPEPMQTFLKLNPITVIIEQLREVLIYSNPPNFSALGVYFIIASIFALISYLMFMKSKSVFADML